MPLTVGPTPQTVACCSSNETLGAEASSAAQPATNASTMATLIPFTVPRSTAKHGPEPTRHIQAIRKLDVARRCKRSWSVLVMVRNLSSGADLVVGQFAPVDLDRQVRDRKRRQHGFAVV